MAESGQRGQYYWLVSRVLPAQLADTTVRFHLGSHVCVTAFDSGPLKLGPDEQATGWSSRGEIAVSPPLSEDMYIPRNEYDEWYVFDRLPPADWLPEIFVNYGSFTLVPIDEQVKTFDPTWERDGLDWLAAIQKRFWAQLELINPVSYIAMGDWDVVVTKRREFMACLRGSA